MHNRTSTYKKALGHNVQNQEQLTAFFIDYLVGFCTSLDGWPGIAGSLRPHPPPIHEDDQRSGCILAVFLDQEQRIDFQYDDRNKITRLDVILLHNM